MDYVLTEEKIGIIFIKRYPIYSHSITTVIVARRMTLAGTMGSVWKSRRKFLFPQ